MASSGEPDVLVIGGGNAALCAALMAREAGASVLMLESAPRAWRGGNSMHVRNLRCMHDEPQDVLVEARLQQQSAAARRKVPNLKNAREFTLQTADAQTPALRGAAS